MNDYPNDPGDMAQELKDSRKERDAEIPMPEMTTTEKLMRPAKDQVEG